MAELSCKISTKVDLDNGRFRIPGVNLNAELTYSKSKSQACYNSSLQCLSHGYVYCIDWNDMTEEMSSQRIFFPRSLVPMSLLKITELRMYLRTDQTSYKDARMYLKSV